MAKIRNDELDQLAGEVLPERTVLSAVPADSSAPFSPFCSANHQANTAGGIQGANNQCGLVNRGGAAGAVLLGQVARMAASK